MCSMGWMERMRGPRPVNIGGTGRKRREGSKSVRTKSAWSDRRTDTGRCGTGKLGEDIALEYLLQTGYKLLERNWRCRYKEIDLIVEGSDGVHIVEVRTRREPAAVAPEQTVGKDKQHHLEAAARSYAGLGGKNREIHFDIVSVILDRDGRTVSLDHIRDAFHPMHSRP